MRRRLIAPKQSLHFAKRLAHDVTRKSNSMTEELSPKKIIHTQEFEIPTAKHARLITRLIQPGKEVRGLKSLSSAGCLAYLKFRLKGNVNHLSGANYLKVSFGAYDNLAYKSEAEMLRNISKKKAISLFSILGYAHKHYTIEGTLTFTENKIILEAPPIQRAYLMFSNRKSIINNFEESIEPKLPEILSGFFIKWVNSTIKNAEKEIEENPVENNIEQLSNQIIKNNLSKCLVKYELDKKIPVDKEIYVNKKSIFEKMPLPIRIPLEILYWTFVYTAGVFSAPLIVVSAVFFALGRLLGEFFELLFSPIIYLSLLPSYLVYLLSYQQKEQAIKIEQHDHQGFISHLSIRSIKFKSDSNNPINTGVIIEIEKLVIGVPAYKEKVYMISELLLSAKGKIIIKPDSIINLLKITSSLSPDNEVLFNDFARSIRVNKSSKHKVLIACTEATKIAIAEIAEQVRPLYKSDLSSLGKQESSKFFKPFKESKISASHVAGLKVK